MLAESELNSKVAFAHSRGQFVYMFNMIITTTTAIFFFTSPSYLFPLWCLITLPIILICRVIDFTQRKSHFFLIDLCYAANLHILLFLVLKYDSTHFAVRTFGLGAGVLGWSTVAFGNGFTMHRMDEFCSIWIHIVPSLLSYTLRWTDENSAIYYGNVDFKFASSFAIQYYVDCGVFYLMWAIAYYLIITKVCRSLIAEGNYATLMKYMAKKVKNSKKLLNVFGAEWREEAFIMYHAIFFTSFTIISYFTFFSKSLHIISIAIQIYTMLYNGGRILTRDIVSPYVTQLEKINSLLTSLKQ